MLLEVLGAVGVTNILVRGSVFAWLRRVHGLKSLLSCAMCTGWWVGWAVDVALEYPFSRVRDALVGIVLFAGAVSALATLLDFTLACLDSHTTTEKT